MAEEFLRSFLKEECYGEFVINNNFFHAPCLKLLISKILGLAIIAGSLIVKVPQILKIFHAGSAKGINLGSNILELAGLLLSLSYNYRLGFPFNTYGETAFITVQNLVIIYQIFLYGEGINSRLFGIFGIYAVAVYVFMLNPAGLMDMQLLTSLQAFNIVILIFARIPQIWTNFSSKSAGQLALITWLLNFGGAAARIFTTMQETGDFTQLVTYVLATSLSGTILFQILFYGNAPPEKETKDIKKKK